MPYITRDDGEHFVIPSYRDVLGYTTKAQLKKDILALSEKYGQYITLQKKGPKYEAAFSPDAGYLLGESVWLHFKRPLDMIYCEVVPNKAEAILVVVKEGSIYLDGQFPIDGIAEELIVFLTQQNQFSIYIYGDVPISREPEAGKFSFEESQVRSFEVLAEPAFPKVKPNKNYQLRLVDVVLKAHHIGVFPTTQVVSLVILALLAYVAYFFYSEHRAMLEVFIPPPPPPPSPYLSYQQAMKSPAPKDVFDACLRSTNELITMPGWIIADARCDDKSIQATAVTLLGGSLEELSTWAKDHGYVLAITPNNIQLGRVLSLPNRIMPTVIYPLQESIIRIMDEVMQLNVTNATNIQLAEEQKKTTQAQKGPAVASKVQQRTMTLKLDAASPLYFVLLAERLRDMPIVMKEIKMTFDKGSVTGSITFDILGT